MKYWTRWRHSIISNFKDLAYLLGSSLVDWSEKNYNRHIMLWAETFEKE